MEHVEKKSLFVTFFLWLFAGIFGAHHFYLRRDRQAFVWWSTLGGYGIGWFLEIFKLHRYVQDFNEDPIFLGELIVKMQRNKRPPFSTRRFTGMVFVAYTWGHVFMNAIPQDEFFGMNWKFLYALAPFVASLGVWTVGNIGHEKGSILYPLLGSYLAYTTRYYFYDENIWFTIVVFAAAWVFDSTSKEWEHKKRKRSGICKRTMTLGACATLYLSLWVGFMYFNGTVTDSSGDEIPVHEAMHHFFTSPWWIDVKNSMFDTWQFAQTNGWYEVWKQVIDLSDIHGEQNAYRILGLNPDASQQDITSVWRKLSREHHPDKVKDLAQRKDAQEKFMEIQQAYEVLSNRKHRRQRRNKKDNS